MLDGFSIHDADNACAVVSSNHPAGDVPNDGKRDVPEKRRPGIPHDKYGQNKELPDVRALRSLALRDETNQSPIGYGR